MTEQDKILKKILSSSADKASTEFSASLAQKLQVIGATKKQYTPLASPSMKNIFLCLFGVSVIFILLLCAAVVSPRLHLGNLVETLEIPLMDYKKIIFCILSFWILFLANAWVQKRFLTNRFF